MEDLNKELKKQIGENSVNYKLIALKEQFPDMIESTIKTVAPFPTMYFSGAGDILQTDTIMLLATMYMIILYVCYYISISFLFVFLSYIFKDRVKTKF